MLIRKTALWATLFIISSVSISECAEPFYVRFDAASLSRGFGIADADFDEDGNIDLVTACQHLDNYYLCFFFGDGSGTFPTRIDRYHNGSRPNAVEVADLNSDHHVDVIVMNTLDNTIGVYLGDGSGAFDTYYTTETFGYPTQFTVDYFNGDQHQDIAAVSWVFGTAGVFLGQGDGFFQGCGEYDVGGGTTMLASADFFEDGNRDLAISNMAFNDIVILLGLGNGGFYGMKSVDVGYDAFAVAAPDLNNDTHADIVAATKHTLTTFLGDGSGGFSQCTTCDYQSPGSRDIEVLDANEDGIADIACSFIENNRLRIYRGDGLGGFPTHRLVNDVIAPYGLCSGDFNGDGHTDIAAASFEEGSVTILLSQWEVVKLDIVPPFDPDIQPGETLTFDLTATNTQDTTVTLDLWLSATRGNGREFRIPSSIINGHENPLELSLEAGEHRDFHYEVEIPFAATPGYFKLFARSGNYANDLMDDVNFEGNIVE